MYINSLYYSLEKATKLIFTQNSDYRHRLGGLLARRKWLKLDLTRIIIKSIATVSK